MADSPAKTDMAVSKALGLSEIVSSIIDALYDRRKVDSRSLLACALVNSRWATDAIPYLWADCDQKPSIRNLALIRPQRQQHYANCIRLLAIDYYLNRFDSLLTNLSYPRLEEFYLRLIRCPGFPPKNPSFLHFFQPRLKSVNVSNCLGSGLENPAEFFDGLRTKCKCLESMKLGFELVVYERDRAAFELLLRETKSFKKIILEDELSNILSPSVFQAIALQPLLRYLDLPLINDQMTRNLGLQSPRAFSSLEALTCWICPTSLKAVLECSNRIRVLDIISATPSMDWLEIIAQPRLIQLESLCLKTTGSSLCALDLLSIANCAPNLRVTCLVPYNPSLSTGDHISILQGFDDIIMEEFSSRVPNLEVFEISARSSELTEQSLISLGFHCPRLIKSRLVGHFDLDRILRNSRHNQWPSLVDLSLTNFKGTESDSKYTDEGAAYEMIEKLVKLMPKLQNLSFHSNASRSFRMTRRYARKDADHNGEFEFS